MYANKWDGTRGKSPLCSIGFNQTCRETKYIPRMNNNNMIQTQLRPKIVPKRAYKVERNMDKLGKREVFN